MARFNRYVVEGDQHDQDGVKDNTPYPYQPHAGMVEIVHRRNTEARGLRLGQLNNMRKLSGKMEVIEDHKEWIMAVASGRVDRVPACPRGGAAPQRTASTRNVQFRTFIPDENLRKQEVPEIP